MKMSEKEVNKKPLKVLRATAQEHFKRLEESLPPWKSDIKK